MAPRPHDQRVTDTLRRLSDDVDAWVATATPDGRPYLVPLSFLWDGDTLLFSTAARTPTARNLVASREARIGVGPTRDVVLIHGAVTVLEPDDLTAAEGDAFAEKTGFDPRTLRDYLYFRVRPTRVQAWREVDELAGRDITL
ncbi:pyridoxamine 5'-phosphate oxidase family protein [Dactylosporangium darangshiense]|uniref:Pyridoxamine 5'-phosphate oxidase N-terminal domain-containing protein n=1 Tax=Dactylosporangium darangshiense TaxID=579108 RepID=A0ABP8DA91_9ACTN